jgi:4-hydroxy-2-oxoheptanedioate aldolase
MMRSDAFARFGRSQGPHRRAPRAALAATLACGVLVSNVAAQPAGEKPRVRLNQVIEQFEQGRPAFHNEHWYFFTLTNSLFVLDDLEKLLGSLKSEGSRPRLTPIVRVPYWGDQEAKHMIKPLLSAGVMGIIVPEVDTKEQALKLVQSMRFPPQRGAKYPRPVGNRGCCPADAPRYWGLSLHDYFVRSDVWPLNPDGELLALVMIESREAIKNVGEILSVPGIGGALIGPHDLSLSLGVGLPESNPGAAEVEEATTTMARWCVERKLICGTFHNPDIKARIAQGLKLFPVERPSGTTAR